MQWDLSPPETGSTHKRRCKPSQGYEGDLGSSHAGSTRGKDKVELEKMRLEAHEARAELLSQGV